jgi:hypothetical protein
VAAQCATSRADEGLVPLSVLPLVTGVIVSPNRNKQEKEHEWSDNSVNLHRERRHRRRAGHYYADVSYKGHERNRGRPQNQFQVGPLGRRSEALGKTRLLDATRGRSSDHDIGPSAGEQKSQHSGPSIYSKKPLLVCQRDFLQISTAALRAAQVHLVTPCSPTSVWLQSFLSNSNDFLNPTRQSTFSCLRLAGRLVGPFFGPYA